MADTCRICGNNDNNRTHHAREMMFGTRERFEYVECGRCGTLQLTDIPDLALHYPDDYYAHDAVPVIDIERGWKRRIVARTIGRFMLGLPSRLGARLAERRPWIADQFPRYLRGLAGRIDFDSRVLDYGCGRGDLLRTLQVFGFRDLTGADKFIKGDLSFGSVKVLKRDIDELDGEFDLIMLHHSFEHLPDPRAVLDTISGKLAGGGIAISGRLAGGGIAIIRIPVVNFAWEKYGVNWVQLDPPRHLFLYTEKAFRGLVERAGFQVERITYDSESFQFFGSEQYVNDIPLTDPRSYRGVISESIFTQAQIDEWESLAAKLNAEGRGDQACFFLVKP